MPITTHHNHVGRAIRSVRQDCAGDVDTVERGCFDLDLNLVPCEMLCHFDAINFGLRAITSLIENDQKLDVRCIYQQG